MLLHIRNMESKRCKIMVRSELEKLDLMHGVVELGEVNVKGNPSREKLQQFDNALRTIGLELMDSKKDILVKKIKDAINEFIFLSDDLPKVDFPTFLSNKVNYDYAYLSTHFSQQQGMSVEKYIIQQKIERVKELLVYNKQSINDIAFTMNYSSVAHLSNQFKKITGMTPSFYRQLRINKGDLL